MLQAREFITHEHIAVGTRKITTPSYLVSVEEEPHIRLIHNIQLSNNANEQKTKIKPE